MNARVRRSKPPCRSLGVERLELRLAMDADASFGPVFGPEPEPGFKLPETLSLPPQGESHPQCLSGGEAFANSIGDAHNSLLPTDVNGDGAVTAVDAFAIINEVVAQREAAGGAANDRLALDVNGDQRVDLRDAFAVIDELRDPGRDTAVALGQSLLDELDLGWRLTASAPAEDTRYRGRLLRSFGVAIGGSGRGEGAENPPVQYVLWYATPDCENIRLGPRTLLVNLDELAVVLVARDGPNSPLFGRSR